ncbi:MAG: type IV pilus assembly protein PilM [Candidatus Pacebacteria bacterium]|nr:type IV pilus assembly protein PilM [Candidatus Paceibacterota bacterium]MBP9780630.1 type IV pilus assembly protein PilM [Candidatus Paceibacterota bacterium]
MDNPFKKILSEGLSFFNSQKTESVIGIDIGSSAIKVVQIKKKNGKAVLETYGALALGPYGKLDVGQVTNFTSDVVGQALVDVLKETNVTTKDGAVAIPSASSLIFTIELPSMVSDADIPAVVPTEARKFIPVPITEVSLDWFEVPKREMVYEDPSVTEGSVKDERREVLVAAIHNDTIEKYRDIIKRADVNAGFFEIEVFSSIRSTLGREVGATMIMDLGASKTKLIIVDYGVVRNFHIVNRGAQDITSSLSKSLNISFTQAEDLKREYGLGGGAPDPNVTEVVRLGLDYVFNETQSVLLNYEKKYNRNVGKIILIGGGALTRGIEQHARESFRSEVVLGHPFGRTEAPAFLEQILQATGPEFAVAVGLALRKLQ